MGEDTPASESNRYEIRIKGHLTSCRAQCFDGLTMTQLPDGQTVLSGAIVDQAALHGVLGKIRDLGLPLLSVRRLRSDALRTDGARCT